MSQLVYSEEEIYSDVEYAQPHEIDGQRMHGGFLADGTYVPPRAKGRNEALAHWAAALKERGVEYVEVRCIDLNPFEVVGINIEQVRFLDTFLLMCLLLRKPWTKWQMMTSFWMWARKRLNAMSR